MWKHLKSTSYRGCNTALEYAMPTLKLFQMKLKQSSQIIATNFRTIKGNKK